MVGISLLVLAAAQGASAADHPKGALGSDALVAANYRIAEDQLREDYTSGFDDPARLINLGQVYANTGREQAAKKLFKRAMDAEDVTIILADGQEISSRLAARRALDSLRGSQVSSR